MLPMKPASARMRAARSSQGTGAQAAGSEQELRGTSINRKRLFANIHTFLYRQTRGMLGHHLGPARILLLNTLGYKTSKQRITPITYFPDGNTFVLVASNYGAETDPIWLRNLRQHPQTHIQVGARVIPVEATEASGSEKKRLASLAVRHNPTYNQYQQRINRDIPLVVLRPSTMPSE